MLPVRGRCLMRMLPVPKEWSGINEEAAQHGGEMRTDRAIAERPHHTHRMPLASAPATRICPLDSTALKSGCSSTAFMTCRHWTAGNVAQTIPLPRGRINPLRLLASRNRTTPVGGRKSHSRHNGRSVYKRVSWSILHPGWPDKACHRRPLKLGCK